MRGTFSGKLVSYTGADTPPIVAPVKSETNKITTMQTLYIRPRVFDSVWYKWRARTLLTRMALWDLRPTPRPMGLERWLKLTL